MLIRELSFDLQENIPPCPFQTPIPVSSKESGASSVVHAFEKRQVHCILYTSERIQRNVMESDSSRSARGSCDRCLAVAQSWDEFRPSPKGALGTNLVIHHGVTNVVGQARQYIRILDVVEETRDFASLRQRLQIDESLVQFSTDLTSGLNVNLDLENYRLSAFLLSISSISPSGAGELRESASPSTRSIRDSIISRLAIVCWFESERRQGLVNRNIAHRNI